MVWFFAANSCVGPYVWSGVTLQLVAFITGLYIAGEIRDIKLTQFLVQQRATPDMAKWIFRTFDLLASIRQFTFLPLLTRTIVKLVMWNGSTAIEICFNTVRFSWLAHHLSSSCFSQLSALAFCVYEC